MWHVHLSSPARVQICCDNTACWIVGLHFVVFPLIYDCKNLYQLHHLWKNSTTVLYVGWANVAKIVHGAGSDFNFKIQLNMLRILWWCKYYIFLIITHHSWCDLPGVSAIINLGIAAWPRLSFTIWGSHACSAHIAFESSTRCMFGSVVLFLSQSSCITCNLNVIYCVLCTDPERRGRITPSDLC